MIRIIISLVIIMTSLPVFAKTVHTIIFGDTRDESIGSGTKENVRIVADWAHRVSQALAQIGYGESTHVFTGADCTPENLLRVMDGLDCREDIVLFYYGGHGGRSVNDNSDYPRMCLGTSDPNRFVKISDIQDIIEKKSPHFSIIIADCCNSYYDGDIPQSMMMPMGDHAASKEYPAKRVQKLFKDRGRVVGTGATKGEYGWINSMSGGFFTSSFLDSFNFSMGRKKETPSWNIIMEDARNLTFDKSNQAYSARRITKTQTPIFDVEITPDIADNTPDTPPRKVREPQSKRSTQTIELQDGMVYTGEIENGKLKGMGKLTVNGKLTFVGEFRDNNIEGGGIYFGEDGSFLVGAWHNGKLSGYGMEIDNGSFKRRYWQNGELVGEAPEIEKPKYIAYSNGYYLGEVMNGKPSGNGKYVWNNGSTFVGTWADGEVNGSGILTFPNNLGFFVGYWEDGQRVRCYGYESIGENHDIIGLWENESYRGKGLLEER